MGHWQRAILLVAAFALGAAGPLLYVTQVVPHWMQGAAVERVVDIETRPGQKVRALIIAPAAATASVVLLAGGHGNLNLGADGSIGWGANNQLVRTRQDYAARGLAVIVPDVASDFKAGAAAVNEYRWSASHARDLAAVTAFAARLASPVYLVGTSMAAISVANMASRPELKPQPAAFVITSGMLMDAGSGHPSVERNVPDLWRIHAPMLALFHRDDACRLSPPASGEAFRSLVSGARVYEVNVLSGGPPAQSEPCEERSAHGFLGVDREVVETVTTWLRRQSELHRTKDPGSR
jgi:dienelactone hydrolase